MMLAVRREESFGYQIGTLTLAMTGFILVKMVNIAFAPAVILYLIIKNGIDKRSGYVRRPAGIVQAAGYVLLLLLPVVVWGFYNRFVGRYVTTGSSQSYNSGNLSLIGTVFASKSSSAIPYLEDVRHSYVEAVFTQDVLLIRGSYAAAICVIVLLILFMARAAVFKEQELRGTIVLTGIWVFLTGIYYALLMYYLYETAFSESEARRLASYTRYMNIFLVAAVYLTVMILFDSKLWNIHPRVYCGAVAAAALVIAALDHQEIRMALPGRFNHDGELIKSYEKTLTDLSLVDENASVYVITKGDNGSVVNFLNYYCYPREISGRSVGPAAEGDGSWNIDYSQDEFVSIIGAYDYLYLDHIDEPFVDKYTDVFYGTALKAEDDVLFRIDGISDNRLCVTRVN